MAYPSEKDPSLRGTEGDDIRREQDDLVRTEVGYDISKHLDSERYRSSECANVLVIWQEPATEFFVFEFKVDSVKDANGSGNWVQFARS